MTDDRKLTAVEWRLYVVALLAAIYIVTWRVLDRPSPGGEVVTDNEPPLPASESPPVQAAPAPMPVAQTTARTTTPSKARPTTPTTIAPRAVWLDQLPARDRPAITPPAGWVVVDPRSLARAASKPATPAATPRLVNAPASAQGAPTPVLRPSTSTPAFQPATPTLRRVPGTRSHRRVRTRSS